MTPSSRTRLALALAATVLLTADRAAALPPFVVESASKALEVPFPGYSVGETVALDGDTIVAGAATDGDTFVNAGAAHVLVETAGVWSEQAKLFPSDPAAHTNFGHSVAIDGDTILVGKPDRSGGGGAYVFVRNAGVWSEQAILTPADIEVGDEFGSAVAVRGDTAIIGAVHEDDAGPGAGAAYVFTRSGTIWTEGQKILPCAPQVSGSFGVRLAVDDDTLIVESRDFSDLGDELCVFVETGGTWSEEAQLQAPHVDPRLGYARVDGDTVVALSQTETEVFVRTGTSWSHEATLPLGSSIDVSGDRLVLGRPTEPDFITGQPGDGITEIWDRVGSTWALEHRLQRVDFNKHSPNVPKGFGWDVEIQGDRIAVGANSNNNIGGIFAFDLGPAPERFAGRKLNIVNPVPGLEDKYNIVFLAKDESIETPLPGSHGDPRCTGASGGGASITISSSTSGESTTQPLPCQNWKILSKETKRVGYKYVDKELDDGACKIVLLKAGKLVKAKCLGRGPTLLDYDLQVGQAQAPVSVEMGMGEWRYCAQFGGELSKDGTDGRLFKAKNAGVPGVCP